MTDSYYSGNEAIDGVLHDSNLDFAELQMALRHIAREASTCILALYNSTTEIIVNQKSDSSPVTEADHASHRLISESLRLLTPNIPILSEESTLDQLIGRREWPVFWMIDPLDGTREFIDRTGEFTINMALIVDARSELGLIAAPNRDYVDIGVPGWGAIRYPLYSDDDGIDLKAKPLDRNAPVTLLASSRHREDQVRLLMEGLLSLGTGVKRLNSGSALKFCDLVGGNGDVYPRTSPCYEWDLAAGDALVRSAGGSVTTLHGLPVTYNKWDSLKAPKFVAAADPNIDYSTCLAESIK